MNAIALLSTLHLIGFALGTGCATAKLALLVKSKADPEFRPTYLRVARPLTRLLITGLVLLLLSGGMWIALAGHITPRLVIKLVLVAAIFVLGPIIDNVVEPRFKALAPDAGASPSTAFLQVQRLYLALEFLATALFYVITVFWLSR